MDDRFAHCPVKKLIDLEIIAEDLERCIFLYSWSCTSSLNVDGSYSFLHSFHGSKDAVKSEVDLNSSDEAMWELTLMHYPPENFQEWWELNANQILGPHILFKKVKTTVLDDQRMTWLVYWRFQ